MSTEPGVVVGTWPTLYGQPGSPNDAGHPQRRRARGDLATNNSLVIAQAMLV
ncbi:hypothetical protein [Janibacter sp. Soil728]|uniref:hypothetical protein n=1 Tax=Janibacter sp. Soil728 TaxID=1736393 RepID=UPI0012E91F7E|nr:hypothetical protein [Janibacter sp. Soil728]